MTRGSYSVTNKNKMGYGKRHKPLIAFHLRLRQEVIEDIRALAKEEEMYMARYVRNILGKWVEYKKKLKKQQENVDKK